jgi:glycosyltransferase involved in cell wall biosynthesis
MSITANLAGVKNHPVISVVMPFWNASAFVAEAVESVLGQTFGEFELIAVDDGSTDRGAAIVEGFGDDRIVLCRRGHDFIESLNAGMALARGRYIARMDADDVMLPVRLERQLAWMEADPRLDVCGSWVERFGAVAAGAPVWIDGVVKMPESHREIAGGLLRGNRMFHPTVMMRADALRCLPWFPDIYRREWIYAEDYGLWTELVMAGFRFGNIPEVLLRYRVSAGMSSTRNSERMRVSADLVRKRYGEWAARYRSAARRTT